MLHYRLGAIFGLALVVSAVVACGARGTAENAELVATQSAVLSTTPGWYASCAATTRVPTASSPGAGPMNPVRVNNQRSHGGRH